MRYLNTITDNIIETECKISGENWVVLDEPSNFKVETSEIFNFGIEGRDSKLNQDENLENHSESPTVEGTEKEDQKNKPKNRNRGKNRGKNK